MAATDLQNLARLVVLGDFGQVQRLATCQLVTTTDEACRTVLMLVADTPETPVQAEKCILYLFELGADPKAKDGAGDTAAHLAAKQDHVRVLALLPFEAKWLQNERGATPLMEAARTSGWRCAKHLMHLLRQDRFNECQNSVRERLLELKDLSGRTALELARLSNHSELASDIEREMRLVVDEDGFISGLTAQEKADREELELLARAGNSAGLLRAATRGTCDLPDGWGRTVLMLAASNSECSDEALWKKLLQLADPTCANIEDASNLHWAASSGNSAAASALIDSGASANAKAFNKFTPLIQAAISAPSATVTAVSRVLLDAGSDWSRQDWQGRTALDWATEKGKSELAELLRGYEGKKYFDEPLELPWSNQVTSASVQPLTEQVLPVAPVAASNQAEADLGATGEDSASKDARGVVKKRFDEDFYPVTDPQGFCLIINVCKYRDDCEISVSHEERKGSERDVARAKQVFDRLRFTVIVKEDLTAEEIDNCLSEIKKSKELVKHGSFVCFLMAHGCQDFIYGSDGVPCEIPALTARFESFVCSGLAGKPKIFFIQSCRGTHRDRFVLDCEAVNADPGAPVRNLANCPAKADFFICYATTEGQASYRKTEKGSIFVQALCDTIEKDHEKDLQSIMNRVNRHMAENPIRFGAEVVRCVGQNVGQLTRNVSFDLSKAQTL